MVILNENEKMKEDKNELVDDIHAASPSVPLRRRRLSPYALRRRRRLSTHAAAAASPHAAAAAASPHASAPASPNAAPDHTVSPSPSPFEVLNMLIDKSEEGEVKWNYSYSIGAPPTPAPPAKTTLKDLLMAIWGYFAQNPRPPVRDLLIPIWIYGAQNPRLVVALLSVLGYGFYCGLGICGLARLVADLLKRV